MLYICLLNEPKIATWYHFCHTKNPKFTPLGTPINRNLDLNLTNVFINEKISDLFLNTIISKITSKIHFKKTMKTFCPDFSRIQDPTFIEYSKGRNNRVGSNKHVRYHS